jgi:serine/threonine protein phosphatase PrpC
LGRFAGQFVATQIIGGRDRQEDDFAIVYFPVDDVERLVMAVADGMGGHAGAAEVARIAVRSFSDAVKFSHGSLAARLRPALGYANTEIALAGARNPKIRGAGCTFVAAAIENETLSWISIGDSSVYLFRDRILRKLNGMALPSPGSGSVPKVLPGLTGAELRSVTTEQQPLKIAAHDAIVVASDGLDCLGDRQVERILRRTAELSVKVVIERLVSSVQSRPLTAQDNTTIIFCRVPASVPVPKSRFPSLKKLDCSRVIMAVAAFVALLLTAAAVIYPI